MINTSNEYRSVINNQNRKYYAGATINLANNTVLTLDNSRIVGLKIENATSRSDTFIIGGAVIGKLTLMINNDDEAYSEYDFTDAVIYPTVGLQLSETIETLQKGMFTAENPKAIGSVISITAYDNMNKFDTPFSLVPLVFPCTASALLNAVCLHCGVNVLTSVFTNSNFQIAERPNDEATTCREIVSWIAQLGGNFARCNTTGALEVKWYDFGVFESSDNLDGGTFDDTTPYTTGDGVDGGSFVDYSSGENVDGGAFLDMGRYHHIYSLNTISIATDDVTITGLQVGDNSDIPNTALYGSIGYVISIEGNELIQSKEDSTEIANSVGLKIVGMKFRPLSITATSDPSREAGDVAYVTDHKQNTYQTLLTNTIFSIGQNDKLACDAESPSRNSSVRYSSSTKTYQKSRKNTEQKLTAYDLVVQQFTNLMAHGFGLYKSEEVLEDGSTIYYMHDKPTRAESSAVWKFGSNGLVLSTDHGVTWGVDTNGNMLVNVLTAIGVNAEWIKVLTSFTVGDNFSVNALGELIAKKGTIGPFILDETGLKSNAMQLLDSDINPLIWLNSEDASEHANYEGSLAYLMNSDAPSRQTALLDSRFSYLLGMELTKETISDNTDVQGIVNERIKYTSDGITKTSTSSNATFIMNLLGNIFLFEHDTVLLQCANGGSIQFGPTGVHINSPSGTNVYINGVAQ